MVEGDYQYDLTQEQIGDREIRFVRGLGPAAVDNRDFPRGFETIRDEVFPDLRLAGSIQYGEGARFDDRKYRLDGIDIHGGTVDVALGLTHFPAIEADLLRGDEGNMLRQVLGKEDYGDKWVYFSRTLGVALVAVTLEGSAFIAPRQGKFFPGWLNAAAGNCDYCGDPSLETFRDQAITELNEEYGARLNVIGDVRFIGISSHPISGDAETVWVARIDVSDSYFLSGKWLKERIDEEHSSDLVQVGDLVTRNLLLNEGVYKGSQVPGIIYSTRMGLEALTERDFMPL
tara:strand:+ start:2557 stop:3417 length:861 start_codon:yes stop_codon:yes gene_type:complete